MRRFLTHIFITMIVIALLISYFRYTNSGQKSVYKILGYYLSYKLDMPIEVQEIKISQLPLIKAKLLLNKYYKVDIKGEAKNQHLNLNYTLYANCFTKKSCSEDKIITLKGTLTGWGEDLKITGEGKTLEGKIHYSFKKIKKQYKDLHLVLNEINASKLLALFNQNIDFKERVNATINLNSTDKNNHDFNITLQTEKYPPFNLSGEIFYDNKKLKIDANASHFGGNLQFIYAKNRLDFKLKNLSLKSLMHRFDIQPLLDTNLTGKGSYDFQHQTFIFQAKQLQAKLLPSPILKSIEERAALSLQDEIFDKSSIELKIKNKTLSSNITLANQKIHFIFKEITFNHNYDALHTKIDIKVPKYSAKGKLSLRSTGIKKNPIQEFYLTFDGNVQQHYHLKLDGVISESFVNMAYNLHAKRLPGPAVTIVDDINLTGHISGDQRYLHISGEGLAMEGEISFKGIKKKEHFEDVSLHFQNIHALKLFTLLGKPTFPNGKADINLSLSYADTNHIKGDLYYTLKKGIYETLPLHIESKAHFQNNTLLFNADIKLSTADIQLIDGIYDFETNTSSVSYTLHTDNLSAMEPLIGKYKGGFSARGKITYNKLLQIRGLSKTFGGVIDFLYKNNMLYIDLENVSLHRIMGLFDAPKLLSAQVNGNINYDYTKEQMLIRTDLNNSRFLNSDLVQSIYKKSGINMLKEIFPYSRLFAIYQHNILAGDLILQNKQSHFIVKHTQLDTQKNQINAHFDLRMQGQAFSGNVFGSLQNPQIKLDLKKLMRYQIDKQVDSVIGKHNRELMESMPMGDVAKDMATDMGAEIMDMFF